MIFLHILLGKGAFFIALHQYRGYVALHEGLRRHLSPLECRRRILILSVSSLNDFGTAQCGPVFFAIATGAFSGRARAGVGFGRFVDVYHIELFSKPARSFI